MKKLIIALSLIGSLAQAETAFLVQNHGMTQSITGRLVWKCEYQIYFKSIIKYFDDVCPSSIEVY